MAKKITAPGASGIKVVSNPGSTKQVVGGNGKHVPATRQGTAPSETNMHFSGR